MVTMTYWLKRSETKKQKDSKMPRLTLMEREMRMVTMTYWLKRLVKGMPTATKIYWLKHSVKEILMLKQKEKEKPKETNWPTLMPTG